MLYPLRTLEAEECVRAMIQHFGIFGVPKDITSDGSTQFRNQDLEEVIRLVGAEYNVTLAHSHQDNAIIERSNKAIVHHIRAFLFDKGLNNSFRLYLPFVQRTMNAEVVSSIGVAPAQILFGNALDLDRSIFMPNTTPKDHDHSSMSEYVRELIKIQKATLQYASTIQEDLNAEHLLKRTASMAGEPTHFEQGTHVLLAYPDNGTFKAGPPNKLMTYLRGPLKVESNVGANYVLRDLVNGRQVNAHVSRLSEYKVDSQNIIKPSDIAIKDTMSQIVESVTGHRGYTGTGSANRISDLELFVKWYGDTAPSWQPWKEFRTNSIAHDYMNAIPHLRRILNVAYRDPIFGPNPQIPAVPRAPPRPVVAQPPAPDVILVDGVLKRAVDIGNDQPTALTRSERKRARPEGV